MILGASVSLRRISVVMLDAMNNMYAQPLIGILSASKSDAIIAVQKEICSIIIFIAYNNTYHMECKVTLAE